MKNIIHFTIAAALAASGFANAQAFSKPSGYVTLGSSSSTSIPANSEVALSVTLDRPTEYTGKVKTKVGNVITFEGTPFTAGAFTEPETPYQILVASGAEIGLRGLISVNDASSVTIGAVVVGELANLQVDDVISISKTWTLSSFFPNTFPAGTRVLAYTGTTVGENLAANLQYVWSGTAWLQLVGGSGNASNTILYPGESFILQTGPTPIPNFVTTGAVPTVPARTVISKLGANSQDNRISVTSPVDEPISGLGLGFTPGDRLLAYNNGASGKNKAPNEVLVWNGSSWIGLVGLSGNQRLYKLKAGVGYVYKRASTAPTGEISWKATQSYLDNL